MGATLTITHIITTYDGEPEPRHLWAVNDTNGPVAELWVDIDSGEILNIWTRPDQRGNGHATTLYRHASRETAIYHAPASHRTPEGDAWARSVGGDSLPCTYGCCSDDED